MAIDEFYIFEQECIDLIGIDNYVKVYNDLYDVHNYIIRAGDKKE